MIVVEQNEIFFQANMIDSIKNTIEKLTKIQCCIFNFTNHTSPKTFEAFLREHHDFKCFFVNNHVLIESFLSEFNEIIFFETSKYFPCEVKMVFKNLRDSCNSLNLKFTEFEFYDLILTRENIKNSKVEEIKISDNSRNMILSKEFLEQNINLVEKLEEKFTIFVRDDVTSSKSSLNEINSFLRDVDILLDEFTGIKILNLNIISAVKEEEFDLLLKNFSIIKLKLKFFYIIVIKETSFKENLIESNVNQSILARFCAKENFENNLCCKMKIVYLENFYQIHRVIEEILSFSRQYRKAFLMTYYQVSKNPSCEEKFLINGGFNSFVSQYFLSSHNLSELLNMTADEFSSRFKLIGPKEVCQFFRFLNS